MHLFGARRRIGIATIATVLLGWLFAQVPFKITSPFARWSFDLLQLILPPNNSDDLVIIYMDEQAMQDYGQRPNDWDRSLHARLLNRLTDDQPRVVVFDVIFSGTNDPVKDKRLADSMRENRRVVLAADCATPEGIVGSTVFPPAELFETNAAAWGLAKVRRDPDLVGRRYNPGDEQNPPSPDLRAPGLAWVAAEVAGAPITRNSEERLKEERWLNYYGSSRPFEKNSMTYTNAETRDAGFFRDKAIFIGGKPDTLFVGDRTDTFRTPFTRWNGRFIPGVELTAIAYNNLMKGDWLRRLGPFGELGILLLAGLVGAFGIPQTRLRNTVWVAAFLLLALIAASIGLLLWYHIWFCWVAVALVQIPAVFLLRSWIVDRVAVPSLVEDVGTIAATDIEVPTTTVGASLELMIPDHTLIRCIGEGAYGQVWVARNAIGLYHAVKVIYRNRFGTDGPYERALRGIQKFMPISRSHPGFVHVLHIGRNEAAGYFFYIMEAADDQFAGQQFDPGSYVPRSLTTDLRKGGGLPPRACLSLLLALTEAAEQLHQHQLIHRDIKPSNIIFVQGHPKLADIDLVTDLALQGEVSRIGTEGYMAPEGPGSAAADVFSLGRILYVVLTGKPPEQCPELPTRSVDRGDAELLLELLQISCKACELDLERRYLSAGAMRAQLLALDRRLQT